MYSLAWTWIDLDIRRIQPWLELSRQDGGTAESTLLLDYPFEFLAFLPFKAGKRKHWLVFLGGTVMMLIFWAVTPMQGAVFGTDSVIVTRQVAAVATAQLGSLDQQTDAMDASILNTAYLITSLKQSFPAFTSADHAYIPFQPHTQDSNLFPDEAWTAETTALSTDLECWPAIATKTNVSYGEYTFDNGRGCTASLTPTMAKVSTDFTNIEYTILYIGYWNDPNLDWFLENPNCTREASHQFLAIWRSSVSEDMTSLFCETSYKKQKVQVTVSAKDHRPDEDTLKPVGQPEVLADDEFNSTAFEYLIGTGVPSKQYRRDYASDKIVKQEVAMIARGVSWPATNMVGYGIGPSTYSLEKLKNATNLRDIYAAAHKRIFSAAISALLQTIEPEVLTEPATVQYALYGVVISRPLSLAVEALLFVIALLVGLVLFLSCRTYSSLSDDPASIGDNLAILRGSDALLRKLSSTDKYDDASLKMVIHGDKFKLIETDDDFGPGLYVNVLDLSRKGHGQTSPVEASPPVHHKALRPLSGVTFVSVLIAGLAILVYLKRKEAGLGGLPRPTNNFEVLQLIENYIPTIFATLLEPFLVLLNRLLCLLQPFHALRKGHRPASKTFDTSYTAIPPQLAIWRAFKAGHFLLGSLCAMSLLANVLAVALGALFNEEPLMVNYAVNLTQTYLPELNNSNVLKPGNSVTYYFDPFYVTMANVSQGTSLPPWTDTEFAYFPFMALDDNRDNSSLTYQARTQGFGVDTVCTMLSTSPDSMPFVEYQLNDDSSQSLTVLYTNEKGTTSNCTNIFALHPSPALDATSNHTTPSGMLAQELATQLWPPVFYVDGVQHQNGNDSEFCERRMLMSWFRVEPRDVQGTMEATHLDCVSTVRSAMFDVTVDNAGYILDSKQVSEFESLDSISANETGQASIATDSAYISQNDAGWHNDTLTRDWMNYLLKLMTNGTSLVDPNKSLPTGDETIPVVQDLYKRLFSATLGLNMHVFKVTTEAQRLTGVVVVPETRIFMDNTAFIITVVILGLNILVATVLYIQERKPFLPRLPSTIGSLAAYVAASQAVRDYRGSARGESDKRWRKSPVKTYSFGKYTGLDGLEHIGIERDPLVLFTEGRVLGRSKTSVWLRKWIEG